MEKHLGAIAVLFGMGMASVAPTHAATIAKSTTAPVVNGADIASFVGATSDTENVSNGNNNATYIAATTPAQGQTFTTGSNAFGYTLSSITVQHRPYSAIYDHADSGTLTLRIGTVSGTSFTLVTSETATLNSSIGFVTDGGGEYVTLTLDTPIILSPDTVYGFDIGSNSSYFELNGTGISDAYAGGAAYSSGVNGVGGSTIAVVAYERVFHVNLLEVSGVPPVAPTGVGTTVDDGQVWLDWADNSELNLTGYNVKRSSDPGGPYDTIATGVQGSLYLDNAVVNGSTYYYVVSAVNDESLESEDSSEASATPQPSVSSTRMMENLDRGVVAISKGGSNVYVGWRMLGTEPESTAFNVYRDGVKINASPITDSCNYLDTAGSLGSSYSVTAVIGGVEQGFAKPAGVWDSFCHSITLDPLPDLYYPNDVSVGDLDGDGDYEIVLKRISGDISNTSTTFNLLEAYHMDGTFMWRINLGPNNLYATEEINPIVYDFDGDGQAEVALRTCEGNIDGLGNAIGDTDGDGITDYRYSVATPGAGQYYYTEGPEFLSIFDGLTGGEITRAEYIERDPISQWGLPGQTTGQYAHRSNKCMITPAYLYGDKANLVICRGIYERIKMEAWDFRDGQLFKLWAFDSADWPGYSSQGNHNLTVGDVDDDGKDEIVYASMCIDNDGSGLYTTQLGHGDALHMSDMIPSRPGLEIFACHEHFPYGTTLRDARTGEILWQKTAAGDTGRCGAAHIDANYPGCQMWSSASAGTYDATTKALISGNTPGWGNFLLWWDADLQREILDATGLDANPILDKWGGDGAYRLISLYSVPTAWGTASNNGTKGNPCISGDLFGDWREEMIYRSSDNTQLRIFSTTDIATNRMYTLLHDSQYRTAVAWQCNYYNQPPHPSFYIGAGMSAPPVPDIHLVGATAGIPAAPVWVTAVASQGAVSLDWVDSLETNIASYSVYRSATSGSGYVAIATGLADSDYTDGSVVNGAKYFYVVTAIDADADESVYSSEVSAVPSATQTTVSFQIAQPTLGSDDVAYLSSSVNDGSNVGGGTDTATYLRHTFNNLGQTFTTGSDPGGYVMEGFWLRHVSYQSWFKMDTPGITLQMRVLQPSGTSLSLLHSEDYTWTASEPGFGLMPPTGNSTDTNGVWMHFEFATPVALDPDTQYAFDVGTTDASVQFYVETAGTSSSGYAGGAAYSTASKGALDMGTVHAGDHTFVVELAGTAVAPDTPTGLAAVSADEQVSLSWNPSANAASYSVRAAFAEGGPYSEVGTPAAESFVDTALTNGITYFYVVAAVGSGGESAETDPVSAVPSPAVAPEEFYIADSVVDAGNILMTVSNSVAGHNYEMLAADALTTNTAWSNVVIQAGTGSNLLFGIPIDSVPTNRFFMLDVQRQ